MTTHKHTTKNVAVYPAIVSYLFLLLLSGCGLAMDNEDRLARGEQAYAEGDYRAAIIDAKDVLLEEPNNMRGRLLLGRASVEVGDGPAAERNLFEAARFGATEAEIASHKARAFVLQRKFDEALNVSPEGLPTSDAEADVRIAHGDALMGKQDAEAARENYMSALELRPDDLTARLGVVSSFVAEGNLVQARGALDQVLDTFAEDPKVWLYSGTLNMRAGEFEAANANFEVARDLAEANGDGAVRVQALAGIAESLFEQQDVDSARQQLDQLASASPDSLQTKLLTARMAYYDEDWGTAQQNLQQVLQIAPNYRPAQVLLGTVHLRSGNLSQAEIYLSSAVASEPTDVRARQLLAETRIQAEKAEEALAALNPILSQSGADPLSLQMAARASLSAEDTDAAVDFLRRNVEENPADSGLRLQLAAALIQIGRPDEAQAVLDESDAWGSEEDEFRRDGLGVLTKLSEGNGPEALEAAKRLVDKHSERFGAFALLGAVQVANRDLAGAKVSFERALELNPDNIVARQYLAAIDESNGDLGAAKAGYEKILEEFPDAPAAMFALGRIAVRESDLETAASYFRRALDRVPENADFRLAVANIERQLGNTDEAEKLLEARRDATLANFPSAVMLGAIKAEGGDIDEALEIADELKERYPENPAAYAFEAEVYVINGDLTRADAIYQKALELGPVRGHALRASAIKQQLGVTGADRPMIDYLEARPLDHAARMVLAGSYLQAGATSRSIAEYEQVLAYEPENPVVLNNLAWSYFVAGDARALETARKAHTAMPENGSIADTLGWILVQSGSVEEGEGLLRQAVELSDGSAEIRYHHAAALAKLGQIDEARRTLDEILAGDEQFSSRSDAESLLAEL